MRVVKFQKNKQGKITKVRERVYFPRSEFHCRFPSLFDMSSHAQWSTYHRSVSKKLDGQKQSDFAFKGNQRAVRNGMYPKAGTFHNPFRFVRYKEALKPVKQKISPSDPAEWYDFLLTRQKIMAAYVVRNVKKKIPDININSDNKYTCVLFSLPAPEAEKNVKVWSQFVSVYLIAMTNKLAYERGINIEMVRRSSFGCLRPAVSECGESVRINLGLVPKIYADCIIDSIYYLNKLFVKLDIFTEDYKLPSLTRALAGYNKDRKSTVALKKTIWDSLWAPGDSSNRSFASQIFRRAVVVEHVIDYIFAGCLQRNLADIFKSAKACRIAFVDPLVKIFSAIRVVEVNRRKTISIPLSNRTLRTWQWKSAKTIEDDYFWSIADSLSDRLEAPECEIDALTKNKKTQDLHSHFEAWMASFVFRPEANSTVRDGYGSDSDTEQDVDINGETKTVYAKKFITATGMRAIQLVYATARRYLHDEYSIDPLRVIFQADHMYYETDSALAEHPIPVDFEKKKNQKRSQSRISFFDLNHCNTTHEEDLDVLSLIGTRDRLCAVDVTSSTSSEIHNLLLRLWKKRPALDVIMTISSGLKNEQCMSDYNPYGTIRIFARDSESLTNIYDGLVEFEADAQYKHPRASHLIRKTAKTAGMTLTNDAILSGPR